MQDYINIDDAHFRIALFCVTFNPIYWNVVSRLEYRTRFLTKLVGNAHRGCYTFAAVIFTLGLVRNFYFLKALREQPVYPPLAGMDLIGGLLMLIGQTLVLSSMWRLGVTGTYNGDYFGILMNERVTKFPFSVCDNPMYSGTTITFLGYSLLSGKLAGLIVTLWVHVMYSIVQKFEEPFTAKIYKNRM